MTPNELTALIDEGLSMARKVPTAGATFASSVSRKLEAIQQTVRKTGRVTPKQEEAVTNMIGGLQKWVEAPTKH